MLFSFGFGFAGRVRSLCCFRSFFGFEFSRAVLFCVFIDYAGSRVSLTFIYFKVVII